MWKSFECDPFHQSRRLIFTFFRLQLNKISMRVGWLFLVSFGGGVKFVDFRGYDPEFLNFKCY